MSASVGDTFRTEQDGLSPSRDAVLLTGFPSLLARSVADAWLRAREDITLFLLVHSKNQRQVQMLLEGYESRDRARIEFVEGDASAIDFGLSGAERAALVRDVTCVHHCAEVTSLGANRATALSCHTALIDQQSWFYRPPPP